MGAVQQRLDHKNRERHPSTDIACGYVYQQLATLHTAYSESVYTLKTAHKLDPHAAERFRAQMLAMRYTEEEEEEGEEKKVLWLSSWLAPRSDPTTSFYDHCLHQACDYWTAVLRYVLDFGFIDEAEEHAFRQCHARFCAWVGHFEVNQDNTPLYNWDTFMAGESPLPIQALSVT